MSALDFITLIQAALRRWWRADTSQRAAAVAYNAVLSLAPLMLILLTAVGTLLGGSEARAQVVTTAERLAGPTAAATAESVVNMVAAAPGAGTAGLAGFLVMAYFSSAVFYHIKSALNEVWGVPSRRGLRRALVQRLVSFLMVLLSVTLVLVTLLIDLVDSLVLPVLRDLAPSAAPVVSLVESVVTFVLLVLLLGGILRHVPDVQLEWRDVWGGAILTALLFTGGNALIGSVISHSLRLPLYGPAGVLIIVLLWVYYGVHLLLLGAHYTREYAESFGSRSARA
jgi:membrane protein